MKFNGDFMRNTSSLQNEIPFQNQQTDETLLSSKMDSFWQRYKAHIMITVLLACLFGSLLHPVIHQKEIVLSLAYLNAFPNVEDEVIINDFENYLQLNCEKQQVLLDSTYYIDNNSISPYAENYSQTFSDNAAAGKFDVVLADTDNFDFFGKQGFFQDLSNILSEKELDKYRERLYYIDSPNDETSKKIPIGIKINTSKQICKTSSYPNMEAYFGVVTGSKRIEHALSYLNYLDY